MKYHITIPVEDVYLQNCLKSGSAGRTNIKRMAYELLKHRNKLNISDINDPQDNINDPQDVGIEFFEKDKFVNTIRLKD